MAPEIQRAGAAPAAVLGGFASGGMCMVGVKWLALRIEERERRRRGMPWGLTAAAAIDTAIDGTIIGMGFALGPRVGAILALALGLELFFLTLSVGSSFRQDGASRGTAIAATLGISLLLVVGAVAGTLVLRDAPKSVLAALLSFGAAALLYLVTEELLVETHVGEETLLSTTMFFLGFLAIFAFVLFGGTAELLEASGR